MKGPTPEKPRDADIAPHPLVALARQAVEAFVTEGHIVAPPAVLSDVMAEQAGVFVSLKIEGRLRGCIGTFEPCQPNVALETIRNAISSATADPRFPPVSRAELPRLQYSVDVLTPPEPVTSLADLDPRRYGVIVRCGGRRGLLLPDLEGVNTVEEQIRIACAKAGIGVHEPADLFRFQVRRYK